MRSPALRNPLRAFIVAASLAIAAPASADTDLTGHWRGGNNVKYEIVQTGTDVTLSGGYEGTVDGSSVHLARMIQSFEETYDLVLSGDGSTLTGTFHTIRCVLSFCSIVDISVTFERCACFDGNADNGDGCDFQCRVEVCNQCSGDPSTCTPVADASPCEDPSVCVSGGACSAGICENGIETAQCIDLSDTWLIGIRGSSSFSYETSVSRIRLVQDGAGGLTEYSASSGVERNHGTFNSATRALSMNGTGSFPSCGLSPLTGVVAANGNTFTAQGAYQAATPRFCLGIAPYDEVGARCASADLEPSDGCSVDSCQRCTGEPPVCEPVPDGTPCVSDDPCSVISTCSSGQCVTALSPYCGACETCDGAGGCVIGPRDDCRSATTKLQIKNVEGSARSSLKWDWRDGGPIVAQDLARPDVLSRVHLCVFDESAAEPALLYSHSVNDGGLEEGWTVDSTGGMRFRNRNSPISSIDLRVGESPKLAVKGGGEGVSLPSAELALPLRAQVQIEGGACFEGSYGSDDVRKNVNGVFKAASAP